MTASKDKRIRIRRSIVGLQRIAGYESKEERLVILAWSFDINEYSHVTGIKSHVQLDQNGSQADWATSKTFGAADPQAFVCVNARDNLRLKHFELQF